MGASKIGVKMALDGESQFKTAVTQITATTKELKSQMALVTSEFQNNANSQEALTAKGKVFNDQINAQKEKLDTLKSALKNAEDNYKQSASAVDEWKKKITDAKAKLSELEASTEDTTKEEKELRQEIEQMEAALGKQEEKTGKAGKAVDEWKTKLNYATVEENNLNAELQKNEKYLDEAANSTDGCATSIDQYGDKVKEAADESEKFGQTSSEAISALSAALAAAGVIAAIKEIAGAIKDCVAASMEFESAVTGVYKTVDGTPEQLQGISDGIKELSLSIPATTTEIAGVAEAAGQLGIATDDVLSFTEVMTNLGVATNLSAEEAATSLAKFANITGTTADNYENLGSAIVALGNNFATNEANIVAMSTKLASAGKLAGLTETQILALATSMSSVGIEAEAGGTAMTQTLTEMEKAVANGGDTLDKFAQVAGMSANEFATAWNTDAMTAIEAFVRGLGGLESQGGSATLILEDLGLTGIRQSNMLKSLALSAENMSSAVEMSSSAWQENTALTAEAGLRYGTTESKVQLLKNSVELLKVAIGDALTPALGGAAGGLAELTESATAWVEANPEMVQAITVTITVAAALTAGLVAVSVAMKALEALSLTNPIGWIAIAAAAAAAGLVALAAAFQPVDEEAEASRQGIEAFRESLDRTRESYEQWDIDFADKTASVAVLLDTVSQLADGESRTASETRILESAITQLNEAIPELNLALDEETGSLNMTTDAMMAYTEAALKQEEAVETAERIIQNRKDQEAAGKKLAEAEQLLAEKQEYLNGLMEESAGIQFDNPWTDELPAAEEAVEGITKGVQDCKDELDKLQDEEQEQIGALRELTGENDSAADSYETVGEKIAGLNAELQNLQTAYDETYKAAKESLEGQFELTEKAEKATVTSYENMKAAIESQIAYHQAYGSNLESLRNREIEGVELLAQRYSDGSTESANAVASFASMSDEQVASIVSLLGTAGDAQSETAGVMADAETGFSKSSGAIRDEMFRTRVATIRESKEMAKGMDQAGAAGTSGRNTGQGFINGLNSKWGAVFAAGKLLGKASILGYNAGTDSHSPSREGFKGGVYVGQGVIGGMESMEAKVKATGHKLGEATIAGIRSSLESFSFSGTSWGAETALATFKADKAKLDHEKAMDLIDEANYYKRLLALRDQFLRDYENLNEWRSTTESIYNYQAGLVESSEDIYKELVEMLDYYLALDLITEADYYAKLTEYRDSYLDESTAAWRSTTTDIYNYQKSLAKTAGDIYQELLADLEHYYAMGLVSLEDYWERRQYLVENYLDEESDKYRSAIEDLQKAQEEYYSDQISTLDFYLALDLITEAKYYSCMEELRDQYLNENSDKWRSATQALYKYQKSLLDEQLSEKESAIDDALTAELAAIDEWLAARKEQVSAELDLEKERVNGIIDSINDEIAARKQAKTEAGYEDAIAAAQKKVDALLFQIEYERDVENLAQLQKELARARQSLAQAEENYSDYLWQTEKEAEIAALQGELSRLNEEATAELEALEAEAVAAKEAAEAAAEAAKAVAQEEYLKLLNDLVEYMRRLVAAAEGTQADSQTGQVTQYDPAIDHTAKALAAETKEEFDYWAEKRQEKIAGEGYDPSKYASTEELYGQWLALHVDYDAKTDYTAQALSAATEREFWAAANARIAKIYGEGYDPSKYASSQELYSQWLAATNTATEAAETAALAAASVMETVNNYDNSSRTATVNVNNPAYSTGQLAIIVQEVLERMAK